MIATEPATSVPPGRYYRSEPARLDGIGASHGQAAEAVASGPRLIGQPPPAPRLDSSRGAIYRVGIFTRTVKMAKKVKIGRAPDTTEHKVLDALRAVLPSAVSPGRAVSGAPWDFVFVIRRGRSPRHLLVDFKTVGEPRYLAQAITRLNLAEKRAPRGYPVVAAPYIGPEGRRLCKEAGVGYLDLTGNAYLRFDGIYVERQSAERPPRARAQLRRLFAPRSSRVVRVLLEHRDQAWTLSRLAEESTVSIRTAHLVVKALEDKTFVERQRGAIRLQKPGPLLDSWAESYRLDQHRQRTFYTFVRSPRETARRLAEQAAALGVRVAFTLHSGAALVAPFVRSSDVHAYVDGDVERVVKALDLRPVDAGGTIHLLEPKDEGVFYGTRVIEKIPVVCNTQLYVDLMNHPARGAEQAAELRRRALGF